MVEMIGMVGFRLGHCVEGLEFCGSTQPTLSIVPMACCSLPGEYHARYLHCCERTYSRW